MSLRNKISKFYILLFAWYSAKATKVITSGPAYKIFHAAAYMYAITAWFAKFCKAILMNIKYGITGEERPLRISVWQIAMADPSQLAMQYTKLALVVALVLVPVGLVGLANMNTSGLSSSEIAILGSVAILIIVGILFAVLDSATSKGKGKHS